jgi:hypothetical protein
VALNTAEFNPQGFAFTRAAVIHRIALLLANATAVRLLGEVHTTVIGASARARFYPVPTVSMLPLPQEGYRRLLVARHGNAVGVIDEPDLPGGVPVDQRGDLWFVMIGVVDEQLARTMPYPEKDFESVINDLVNFLQMHGVDGSHW